MALVGAPRPPIDGVNTDFKVYYRPRQSLGDVAVSYRPRNRAPFLSDRVAPIATLALEGDSVYKPNDPLEQGRNGVSGATVPTETCVGGKVKTTTVDKPASPAVEEKLQSKLPGPPAPDSSEHGACDNEQPEACEKGKKTPRQSQEEGPPQREITIRTAKRKVRTVQERQGEGQPGPAQSEPDRVAKEDKEEQLMTLAEAEQAFRRARDILDLSYEANAVIRQEEEEILTFVKDHVLARAAGALYISGTPGTGKTLTLGRVLEKLRSWERQQKKKGSFAPSRVIELNGMRMKAEQIEEAILKALDSDRRLENALVHTGTPNMTILVLDELDQLIMAKQTSILEQLFEIAALPKSSLIFIGVANDLRLKDHLPVLQTAKYGNIRQITFQSYDAAQLLEILRTRQSKMGYQLFDDMALQFCSKQAATSSGDARRALHLAQLAVEGALKDLPRIWAGQAKKQLPRVTIAQMLPIINGPQSNRVKLICELPFHQQLVLCCLVLAVKNKIASASGSLAFDKVYDTYRAVCKRDALSGVTLSEFSDMCSTLEGHGLIAFTKTKGRFQKLMLQASEAEVHQAAQQKRHLLRALGETS